MSKVSDQGGAREPGAPPPDERENAAAHPGGSEKPAFDPYASLHMTMPAEVRKQYTEARLPRLAPEFLQDTLPPNQAGALMPPTGEAGAPDTGPSTPRRTGWIVAALLFLFFVLGVTVVRLTTRPPPSENEPRNPTALEPPLPVTPPPNPPKLELPALTPAATASSIDPAPPPFSASEPAKKPLKPKLAVSATQSLVPPSSPPEAPPAPSAGRAFWQEPR